MEGPSQSILNNIGQVVGEEFRQLRAVGGEIAELRDELATMNALLRMQSEAEDGAVDHFVREWMKQLHELAYDVDDCVDLYIFRIRCGPKDKFLVWSKRLLATLFPRHRLDGDIRALRARAISIGERHARYGVSRDAMRPSPSLGPARAAASFGQVLRSANDTNQFVGIEDQATFLAEKVKAEVHGNGDMSLKVFSIVGFGGLGKTTLAMEVCRHHEAEFDRQAQVSVSQMFDGGKDLKDLLKRLLRQIVINRRGADDKGIQEEDPLARIDTLDVDELARKLQDLLKDKRYLIVIDDVWTVAAWDAIHCNLLDNKCGSRILVTTRIETVAKECSDPSVSEYYIYRIEPLSPENSKKLFLCRAFGSINDAPTHEAGLADRMDNILKKCAGLPLAIVSIASMLASYKYPERKDMWEMICKSIGSHMESNPTLEGMCQILTLSYNHLPYHLKACMMYLSIFPEDYVINKKRLLYRWIAEGLIEEKRGLSLLVVAESYFQELMSRSMIDPAYTMFFEHKESACRVHDMMLEVMVSKSLEANFVSLVGGQYEGMLYDRVRRLSIHGLEEEPMDSPSKRKNSLVTMDMQHVRSLSMFEIRRNNLFDRLREFTLLRVLDLEGCEGLENSHVVYICHMYLLKFLSLKGTNISVIPQQVGELEHLQVLDVRQTGLTELPAETLSKLQNLERVDLRNSNDWSVMWNLPNGISKMKALRHIGRGLVCNVQIAREIGELGKLQAISLFVPENPGIFQELILSVSKLHSLRSFHIARMTGQLDRTNLALDMPSPPRLLRYLCIDGQSQKFPSWVSSLSYLTTFSGIWLRMHGDDLYGVLCNLPSLQTIMLHYDCYMDKVLVARSTHNFPVLKTLWVCTWNCHLPEVVEFEKGSMDKLEELSVQFCDDRSRSIVGIQHLQTLKEVQLTGKKHNNSLCIALEELKAESRRRPKGNQFKVVVRYM